MTSEELPPPIHELIAQHIRSMDHAEAVLILAGERERTHTVSDVAANTRWGNDVTTAVLEALANSGVAVRLEEGYRLAPHAPDAGVMTAFSHLYRTRPVTLVRAIYSTPLAR